MKSWKTENVLCGLENESQTDLNKKDVCHFWVHNVYMFLCALLPVAFETVQPLESSDVMKLNRNLEGRKLGMNLGLYILLKFCHFLTLIKLGICMTFSAVIFYAVFMQLQ